MSSYYQKQPKNNILKRVLTAIACVLAAVLLLGVCLQFFGQGKAKPSEWFKPTEQVQPDDNKPTGGVGECKHVYENGKHVCTVCGELTAHIFADGKCSVCGECEKHTTPNAVNKCTVCNKALINYNGVAEIDDFVKKYPDIFLTAVDSENFVLPLCTDTLSTTKADGVIVTLSNMSFGSVQFFNHTEGRTDYIDMSRTDNGYTFVYPESDGTVMVYVSGDIERVLPEDTHNIVYELDNFITFVPSVNVFISGADYAKAGDWVVANVYFESNDYGVPLNITINSAYLSSDPYINGEIYLGKVYDESSPGMGTVHYYVIAFRMPNNNVKISLTLN